MSMFDLTQLSDDALRATLFDALVERLDAEARADASIVVVNRMPTVLTISKRAHLLTLSQGLGVWLLRGVLKWDDGHERLRTFNVSRASMQSRLSITPDGITGTPDEILDWIVATFVARTAEERRPAVAEPAQETRSAARVQQDRPTRGEAVQEPPATSSEATQDGRPATTRPLRNARPSPIEVTRAPSIEVPKQGPLSPQIANKPSKAEAAPRSGPIREREKARPPLRTYQLLFEIAQRELRLAKALPVDSSRYFLISAGVSVALTAEAFLNDLGSRVMPSWGQLQRLDPREKAEVLNIELFKDKVDWSVSPFHSVAAALGFRRALAHAHAETLPVDAVRTADRSENEVPRTRRTVWQEHCDIATLDRWTTDVRLLIEHFSRGHDPTAVAVNLVDQASASSSDDAGTGKKLRPGGSR